MKNETNSYVPILESTRLAKRRSTSSSINRTEKIRRLEYLLFSVRLIKALIDWGTFETEMFD